jgi:flagellar hook-basal body complex protein FliE
MTNAIQDRLSTELLERATQKPTESGAKSGPSFGDVLKGAVESASALDTKANEAAEKFATGEGGIHEVMIAQEKAAISVRYAVTLKNKMLDAYRELMNTPI